MDDLPPSVNRQLAMMGLAIGLIGQAGPAGPVGPVGPVPLGYRLRDRRPPPKKLTPARAKRKAARIAQRKARHITRHP